MVWWSTCKYHRFPKWEVSYLIFSEGVVECKSVILDIFGDAIHFVFGFMDFYLRICARNRVDLPVLFFLLKDRTLPDADSELCCWFVTLRSMLEVWGESSLSLNLFFSIMSSKSMSTFLPLLALMIFFSSFYLLASSILSLRSSLFFSIFLI